MQGAAGDSTITIRFTLEAGDVVADATALGNEAAKAFQTAFKPALTAAGAPGAPGVAAPTAAGVLGAGTTAAPDQTILGRSIGEAIALSLAPSLTKSFSEGLKTHLEARPGAAVAVAETVARRPAVRGDEAAEGGSGLIARLEQAANAIALFGAFARGGPLLGLSMASAQYGRGVLGALATARGGVQGETTGESIAQGEQRRAGTVNRLRDYLLLRGAQGGGGGAAAEGAEAAEGIGGAEAAAGIVSRTAGLALRAAPLAYAGYEVVHVAGEAGEALENMGKSAANTIVDWQNMAKTMGLSDEAFAKMRLQFAGSGIDIDTFSRSLLRTTVAMGRDMPEAVRAYADSGRIIAESNIKITDSGMAVTRAQIGQQDATLGLAKAQEGLSEQLQTGQERREEQLQGVQLGVSGAGLGLVQAQLGTARADIGQRFANREQQNQRIEAADSSAGARLGLRGAELALAAAQGEDVSGDRAELNLATLQHNVETARTRVSAADLAEERQRAERQSGLGPVDQAELAREQAAQSEEEAKLRQRTAETALKNEETRQKAITLEAENAQAQRSVLSAQLAVQGAPLSVQGAEIQRQRLEAEQPLTLANVPSELAKAVEDIRAGRQPGINLQQVTPDTIRTLLYQNTFQATGGRPTLSALLGQAGDLSRTLVPDLSAPGAQNVAQNIVSSFVPGVSRLGPANINRFITALQRSPQEAEGLLTPEDFETISSYQRVARERGPEAAAFVGEESQKQEQLRINQITNFSNALPAAEDIAKISEGAREIGQDLQGAAGSISSGLDDLVHAITGGAREVEAARPGAAEGKADGGLISGPGTSTSDSIPLMASDGEYIIRASTVRKVGVPMLDSLNAMRFSEGGMVSLRRYAEGGGVSSGTDASGRVRPDLYLNYLTRIGAQLGGTEQPAEIPVELWNAAIHQGLNPYDVFDPVTGGLTVYGQKNLSQIPEWLANSLKAGNLANSPFRQNVTPGTETGIPEANPLDSKYLQPPSGLSATTIAADPARRPKLPTVLRGGYGSPASGVTVFRGGQGRSDSPGITSSYEGGSHIVSIDLAAYNAANPQPDTGPAPADLTPEDLAAAGFAGGGLIPTLVSNGEYRMGANAVAHYGPGFFHALNSGKFQFRALGGTLGLGSNNLLASSFANIPSFSQLWGGISLNPAALGINLPAQAPINTLPGFTGGYTEGSLSGAQQGQLSALSEALGKIDLGTSGNPFALPSNEFLSGPTGGYTLDLRTPAGTFPANISEETMAAIQMSSIGSQLSSAGTRPSWYS